MFYGKNDSKNNDDNNHYESKADTHKINDDINNYDASLDTIEKEIDSLNEKRMRILSIKKQKEEKNKIFHAVTSTDIGIMVKDDEVIIQNKIGNELNLNHIMRKEISKNESKLNQIYHNLLVKVTALESELHAQKRITENIAKDIRKEKKVIKTKKEKAPFNGSHTLWIRNDGKTFYKLPNETPIGADDYHIATQREINEFFRCTKTKEHVKDDYKYYHYGNVGYFSAYCKEHNRLEYSKRLDGETTRTDITKEEYDSHFRKEF